VEPPNLQTSRHPYARQLVWKRCLGGVLNSCSQHVDVDDVDVDVQLGDVGGGDDAVVPLAALRLQVGFLNLRISQIIPSSICAQ
jgi:hypothetical protein